MKPPPFTVTIDTREQRPFDFGPDISTVLGTLDTGDYSIAGLEDHVALERKSLPDLAACITHERDRFKRELRRLRGYECRAVIIEATVSDVIEHRYRSRVHPNAVLGSVATWQTEFGVPFVWAGPHGATFALAIIRNYWRQLLQTYGAIRHAVEEVTAENHTTTTPKRGPKGTG